MSGLSFCTFSQSSLSRVVPTAFPLVSLLTTLLNHLQSRTSEAPDVSPVHGALLTGLGNLQPHWPLVGKSTLLRFLGLSSSGSVISQEFRDLGWVVTISPGPLWEPWLSRCEGQASKQRVPNLFQSPLSVNVISHQIRGCAQPRSNTCLSAGC